MKKIVTLRFNDSDLADLKSGAGLYSIDEYESLLIEYSIEDGRTFTRYSACSIIKCEGGWLLSVQVGPYKQKIYTEESLIYPDVIECLENAQELYKKNNEKKGIEYGS